MSVSPSLPGFRTPAGGDHFVAGLIFVALASLYLYTAPRTVVLEDDGLFILSSYFLGIEHPPGYPLFVLLGKLATLVPVSSVAWRVHALSGLLGAAACVMLYRIARGLLPGQAPALLTALGLGVSGTFWSQAIIADVYSLHCLIFFALLWLALAANPPGLRHPAADDPRLVRHLDGSALLFGLGLANHWPLLLLSAPALVLLWWPARAVLWARLPRVFGLLALGLLPYAWMVWRSWQMPPISFQGPLTDWQTVLDFLLRRGYRAVDQSDSANWLDRLGYALDLLNQAAAQLLLSGALLALLGVLGQWRAWGGRIATALTLAFAGPTLVLILLLGFDHEGWYREAFRVYPVVAWGVLALWAGLGLHLLVYPAGVLPAAWLAALQPLRQRVLGAHAGLARRLTAATVGLLVALPLAWHWPDNDRRRDWLGRAQAEALLASAPAGALLMVRGDTPTPAVAYLHLIEGQRPDLLVISEDGLILEPRAFDPRKTPEPDQVRALAAFITASGRPPVRLHYREPGPGINTWLTVRLPMDPETTTQDFLLPEPEQAFLRRVVGTGPFRDGWSELLRQSLLGRFAWFMTYAQQANHPLAQDPHLRGLLDETLKTPRAALYRADVLDRLDPLTHRAEIAALLARFATDANTGVTKSDRAAAFNILANQRLRAGDGAGYRAALQASVAAWPSRRNPVWPRLEKTPAARKEPGERGSDRH